MTDHQRIDITTLTMIGDAGPLPAMIAGLDQGDLNDLSFLPAEHGFGGIGYWPVVADDPAFDADTQTLDAAVTRTLDAAGKRVLAARSVRPLTEDELAPIREARKTAVMAKRDAEIDAGVTFNGVRYQTRATDRENIAGAAQLAFMAIVAGAQPGDLRWLGGDSDFGWIALDNTVVPMDAQTVVAFGRAAAARKSACIFHARALKQAIAAAANPAAVDIDAGWPAAN